ncbi:UNVERIFIED_CONTAM: hypothetical protein RMT77_008217 [Armadillidium vulgare]
MLPVLCVLLCLTFSSASEKIVELDHEIGPEIPYYPSRGIERFKMDITKEGYKINGLWEATQKITANEHTGTHLNAPILFNAHGRTVDDLRMESLFEVPVAVIDISEKLKSHDVFNLTGKDVRDWTAKHGMFINNSVVLINTGWSSKWPNQLEYFGSFDDPTKFKWPGITFEAIQELLRHKDSNDIQIEILGTDAPTLGSTNSLRYPISRYIADQNIFFLSMLKNLHLLPPKGASIMIMPMKIKEGTGAPARVWAKVPTTQ